MRVHYVLSFLLGTSLEFHSYLQPLFRYSAPVSKWSKQARNISHSAEPETVPYIDELKQCARFSRIGVATEKYHFLLCQLLHAKKWHPQITPSPSPAISLYAFCTVSSSTSPQRLLDSKNFSQIGCSCVQNTAHLYKNKRNVKRTTQQPYNSLHKSTDFKLRRHRSSRSVLFCTYICT